MRKKPVDKVIILLTALLCAVGLIMVFSASFPYSQRIYGMMYSIFLRQLLFCIAGFAIMFAVSYIPYTVYQRFGYLLWLGAIILCLLVQTPLGTDLGTFARRWIHLGPATFMPSDLMKIGAVFAMAKFIVGNRRRAHRFKEGLLPAIGIIAFTAIPIALQPDTSTMFIVVVAAFAVYFIFAMRMRYIVPLVGVGVFGFIAFILSDTYRIERITAMWDPLADYYGTGWQLSQSLFAVSAGGFFGRGLGKSIQKFSNLSEAHNDFIFAVLSEELGFIGALFVIVLFAALVIRMIQIAFQVKQPFARYTCVGIAAVIALQAFVNITVAIGLIPPTGVTLPFISYGGTSLIIFLMMMGVVLQISRNRVEEKHENHT